MPQKPQTTMVKTGKRLTDVRSNSLKRKGNHHYSQRLQQRLLSPKKPTRPMRMVAAMKLEQRLKEYRYIEINESRNNETWQKEKRESLKRAQKWGHLPRKNNLGEEIKTYHL